MANGAALDHAIELSKGVPQLDLGIHLCLNDVTPICPEPVLRDLSNKDGTFFSSYSKVISKIITKPALVSKIKGEFRAQIEHLLFRDIKPSHINSHKHLHVFPSLWSVVGDLAREYQIPFIRYPLEEFQRLIQIFLNPKGRKKTIKELLFFSAFFLFFFTHFKAVKQNRGFVESSIRIPDFFCGLYETGILDVQLVLDHIRNIKPGITELMCHPGYVDEDLRRFSTRLLDSRQKEADLLCSSVIMKAIKDNDVEVTSFDECHTLFHSRTGL